MSIKGKISKLEAINTSNRKDRVFKIIVGGDGGIGKTTLLKVLCGECYTNQDMTIGFEIFTKKVHSNGHKDTLQIWDLSGQDHFRFLLPDYFKGAHGIVLGFDMSRRISFLNLRTWMTILMAKCPDAPIILIATKSDLGYHPTLSRTLAEDFVVKFNIVDLVEVSAKNHLNVDEPFKKLVESIKGFEPGAVSISLSEEAQHLGTIEPEKSPDSLNSIKIHSSNSSQKATAVPKVATPITHCPNCNHPLRESQIKLKQLGHQVLCQNCYTMV
ncbi:MAG: GTP-binding protein [Candidatus Helarchaeota archaeon]|nr:GTP-binding protein [Candidatus Helarchaeota archaeon]